MKRERGSEGQHVPAQPAAHAGFFMAAAVGTCNYSASEVWVQNLGSIAIIDVDNGNHRRRRSIIA